MNTEKKHIFDNPKNVQRVLYALFSCPVGAVVGLQMLLQNQLEVLAYGEPRK